ncbi:16576_t:CDS:1, partial [Cetraspora pellucida]
MSSNDNLSSRLELQKRLQDRLKSRTDTTSRPTPRTYDQLPQYLQLVLPDNYTYIIKSYKEIEPEKFEGAPPAAFDSTFYVNIASTEAIEEWRAAFHNKTGTIFRITRADKVKGIKVIYHKDFHCRHADIAAIKYMQKTYAQKAGQRRSRNTNCQCLAKIRLEKSRLNLSHPCEIHLLYNHNHPLETLNITPQTPSIASVGSTSDESGKSTPQHTLEFESSMNNDNDLYSSYDKISPAQDDLQPPHQSSPLPSLSPTFVSNKFHQFIEEIDLDILKGDNEYCRGIVKFMESYRQARAIGLSNATQFFNQLSWTDSLNQDAHIGSIDAFPDGNEGSFIEYSPHPQFSHQFTTIPVQFSNVPNNQYLSHHHGSPPQSAILNDDSTAM